MEYSEGYRKIVDLLGNFLKVVVVFVNLFRIEINAQTGENGQYKQNDECNYQGAID
jgi:hypothetical protein